jgi:hypothetical protein
MQFLDTLTIRNILAKDFTFLQEMKSLQYLNIANAVDIRSISDIGNHNSLKFLILEDTLLVSLDGIENLIWLEDLRLFNVPTISDFSQLDDHNALPRLKAFWISENMIQHLNTLTRDDITVSIIP